MLVSVMYEVSTTCPGCGQPLPLNGASQSVLCGSCQRPMATPDRMWSSTIGQSTSDALGMNEGEGRNATAMLSDPGLTVKYVTGRLSARCGAPCKTPYPDDAIREVLGRGGGDMFCGACGKKASVRPAPDWFKAAVHPSVVALVGETVAAEAARRAPPEAVRFHCYHCGAPMPIDGSQRSVPCTHCHAGLVVPDDIWVRLHPAATIDRWYALVDVGNAVGVLPEDCRDFADFTVEPSGRMVVAWHDNDSGDAGHPCRIALVDRNGMLLWKQDGIEFDDDETLIEVSPGDARLVLIDGSSKGGIRFLDPADGSPTGTLRNAEADGPTSTINVRDHRGVAIDWDGSFLVFRDWTDGRRRSLRRFDRNGNRIEVWPGVRKPKDSDDVSDLTEVRDHPVVLPYTCHFVFGWDGLFHVVSEKGDVHGKWGRDGKLVGVRPSGIDSFERVTSIDVARDGTLYVLGRHATKIGDDEWAHVMRVPPNGPPEPWLGPHVSDDPLIGQWDDELELLPDATVFIGRDLDSLRVIAPDRTVLWSSLGSRRREESIRADLAKARRGKKLAADRG